MINPKKIEEFTRKMQEALPKNVRDLGEDIEKKLKQAIQNQLSKLDLITREEFDVQTQVLLRTREKLAQLENQLAELENKINNQRIE